MADSLQDYDVVRVQYLWDWVDTRRARSVQHFLVAFVSGVCYPKDFTDQRAPSLNGAVTRLLADGVDFYGMFAERIFPTGPSLAGGTVVQFPDEGLWSPPWMMAWGSRMLWSVTGDDPYRYDPWMVIPFVPGSEVSSVSGVPRISDAFSTELVSQTGVLGSSVDVSASSGSFTMIPILWSRASSSYQLIVNARSDRRVRHIRRRNVYWRELEFPV